METLGKIVEAVVKYGPAAIEAFGWIGERLVKWLSGEDDFEAEQILSILPSPLLSRLEMIRGRKATEDMLREELDEK